MAVLFPRAPRRAGFACRRVQDEFLNAPIENFTDVYFVLFSAVHFVHGPELLQLLASCAELARNGAVKFHFVDRCVVKFAAVRIGAIEILPSSTTQMLS
jgi:hypothetical protein